ncbi:sensor domain-containing protein, partial [Amycolatopsis sp. NPDC000673]|uniref:sensor histidine kinase n=1 Tax=Amycolatopsis sp. NPDC000673 TaxID=3154267 RepID=UPI00331D92E2
MVRDRSRAGVVRSVAYLLSGVPLGVGCLLVIVATAGAGVALAPVAIGLGPLLLLCQLGIPVARLERRRLRWVSPEPVPVALRSSGAGGWWRRSKARLRERATWQELGYTALLATLLWVFDLLVVLVGVVLPCAMILAPLVVAVSPSGWVPSGAAMVRSGLAWVIVPLGAVALAVAVFVLPAAAGARARVTRVMLEPARGGEFELVEVRRSRARMVDQHEAERRRIERDLHDGAQQRLTSLAMMLGLARTQLDAGSGPGALVDRAHAEAKLALAELGDLIRGIHPKILSDRGLDAALGDLADRCALPVRLDTAVGARLPDSAESAAYYAVSEALTNVVKHSGADRAEVVARYQEGVLLVEIRDNGRGGADQHAGGRLTGLRDRAGVVGGAVGQSSPPGRPTQVRLPKPS